MNQVQMESWVCFEDRQRSEEGCVVRELGSFGGRVPVSGF